VRKILISVNLIFLIPIFLYGWHIINHKKISGAPEAESASQEEAYNIVKYDWIYNWKRPDGPAKVALQVGHWKNDEFPDELAKLRNNGGASGGGKSEWEVNLAIAQETAKILREKGIYTEVLPATVPRAYYADVFLAIHADGSEDSKKRGFKIAGPWRDFTNNSDLLVDSLSESYKIETGFEWDPNITRNMRGYYAFSWWRFEHAIHPMTTAAIIETGFLTNYHDQQIIVNRPQVAAQGIAQGIINYLKSEKLI
jgi:hypothetical protein